MTLRLRRGTEAERVSVIFQEGELVYVTDTKELYSGDGVTPGGIKVSNVGSPDALTQNLDLDGFNIFGSGSITATAFIGDGSGLTNVGGGGIVDGSNYRINIAGDDSSIIVNSTTNTVTGVFVGDGGGLTNILVEQLDDVLVLSPENGQALTYSNGFWINSPVAGGEGVVEGGNYKINIVGVDSTTIVDIENNTINTTSISAVDVLEIITPVETAFTGIDDWSILSFVRNEADDLSDPDTSIAYGVIKWDRDDINGRASAVYMQGGSDGLKIFNITNEIFDTSKSLYFRMNGNFGFGTDTPATKVEIKDGSLRFNESRDLIDISPPSTYELTANIATNKLAFYDGLDWYDIVGTPIDTTVTTFPGPIAIEGITEVDRNDFGQDSVAISGSMIYNTTADRFEFFQAGSWIPLANQELEETSNVQFATVTADSFISTGGGAPTLESETVINLQAVERVQITTSPFRLAQLTTTERNLISPVAGDLIYNTTDNRFQGYQNGGWINLDDGTAA
jgi:hypothetical protein